MSGAAPLPDVERRGAEPDTLAYPPRGLSRDEAARYIGVGTTTFDRLVEERRMPRPFADKRGRRRWRLSSIDRAFDHLFYGTVYAIQAFWGSPIKIGFTGSGDVRQRMAELQIGNPHPLRLIGRAPGTPTDEHALHAALAADRLKGEWFLCTPRVQAVVEAMMIGIDAALARAKEP